MAKDVAAALGYASTNMPFVFKAIPEKWKGSNPIATLGGVQNLLMISEQGLYFFLGRSDKPNALPYQMWIADQVMPDIRKHGVHMTPAAVERILSDPDFIIRLASELKQARSERDEAIRTKAWIGTKREVTAMCTASNAVRAKQKVERENQNLKNRIGEGETWKQVRAIPWLKELLQNVRGMYVAIGMRLKRISTRMGYEVKKLQTSEYPDGIGLYHKNVIDELHAEMLADPCMFAKYRKRRKLC